MAFDCDVIGIDGQVMRSVPLPKGTTIIADITGINTDEGLWGPDAKTWRPERWLEGIPPSVVKSRVPSVYSHMCVMFTPTMHVVSVLTASAF